MIAEFRTPSPEAAVRPLWWNAVRISIVVLALASCTRVQGVDDPPGPRTPPSVTLDPAAVSSGLEAEAARLYARASNAFEDGRYREALELAERVVEGYAGAPASGDAAWLLARAAMELQEWRKAADAAGRLARAFPPGDPRAGEVRFLEAEALARAGSEAAALDRLLLIPPEAPTPIREEALDRVRELVRGRELETLEILLRGASSGQTLAAPVMAAYARLLRLAGRQEEAERYARAALDLGARGPDAETARTVLEGEPTTTPASPVALGALLPASGSPAVRDLASGIEEGVRTAMVSRASLQGVDLEVRDHGGAQSRALAFLDELGQKGTVGVIGPLEEEILDFLAERSRADVPMISPTATRVDPTRGVYSLASPDSAAPRLLASYAARSGIRQVVVIHSTSHGSRFEAGVFEETFEAQGGSVLRNIAYEPGTTFFEDELRQAEVLEPEGLVLPVPARDIQALAPQVSFFGLDTLGIKVLGTAEWTDPDILREVAERHTNGVVVATPQRPGPESEGYRRFVDAYEGHFQRSLRDPLAPALGYDAASLFLVAIASGARNPTAVRRALEAIEGFEGATGVLSVEDGRIVRRHHLVCIQDRTLRPVEVGEVTTYYRPMRRGDPEENEPERVPTGAPEFYCPGTEPPHVLSDSILPGDTVR